MLECLILRRLHDNHVRAVGVVFAVETWTISLIYFDVSAYDSLYFLSRWIRVYEVCFGQFLGFDVVQFSLGFETRCTSRQGRIQVTIRSYHGVDSKNDAQN